jgi:hypothetical protein
MPHSNRAKLKAARGGMTRNQLRKSKNAGKTISGTQRLQETINWIAKKEQFLKTENNNTAKKVVVFTKIKNDVAKRKSALKRLENQLKSGLKPLESTRLQKEPVMQELTDYDKKRIEKEILILKSRI